MCFKRKRSNDKLVIEDRDQIDRNQKAVDVLIAIYDCEEFRELQQKIKYLKPSSNKKVIDYDTKIKNSLDDIKIELHKKKSDSQEVAEGALKSISILIAERNVHL